MPKTLNYNLLLVVLFLSDIGSVAQSAEQEP